MWKNLMDATHLASDVGIFSVLIESFAATQISQNSAISGCGRGQHPGSVAA
eukprot:SAG11_NODE_3392_length_2477_cov_1.339781_3_plen_51_part_00